MNSLLQDLNNGKKIRLGVLVCTTFYGLQGFSEID